MQKGDRQMTFQQQILFAFGAGYTVKRLSLGSDWRVIGLSRTRQGANALKDYGIEGMALNSRTTVQPPPGAHWLISNPPDEQGCSAFRFAGAYAHTASSITYLSTTGVYGDLSGGWAFEWSERRPISRRAERRVIAEDQWRSVCPDVRFVRLPGIYGPGRSSLERVSSGKASRIVKPGQVFSRVHVDDLAAGLRALLHRPYLSGVFHLCDDEPAPPQDIIAYAAQLLDVAAPPAVAWSDADLGPMGRSFYAECKRVSNARAKAALGWRPQYPTYREGLCALHKASKL